MVTVFAPQTEFFKTKTALQNAFEGIEFEVEEIQFVPQNTQPIAEEDMEQFDKFMDMMEDLDDVQKVYHNGEL